MKPVFYLLISLFPLFLSAQSEADYINIIAQELNGETEIGVASGRVDILTNTHAIEVERAPKWKNAIGQALWYGLQMNKKAGIILILENPNDYKYFIQLNSALDYADLSDKVEVWLFPNDFPNADFEIPEEPVNSGGYWLTNSTKTRHNSTCPYYKKTRGKACASTDGQACRRCGG